MTSANTKKIEAQLANGKNYFYDKIVNIIKITLYSISLFVAFLAIYIGQRHIYRESIVFYNGIFCLFIFTLIATCIWIYAAINRREYNYFLENFLYAMLVSFLFSYSFIITIPSLLDRSISLYILSSIVEAGDSGASKNQIDDWFARGFIARNDAVAKRLHEQIITGNIIFLDGQYKITKRGVFTYDVYKAMVSIFKTDSRYVITINHRESKTGELEVH